MLLFVPDLHRRQTSTPRGNRSPSPSSLNGGAGGHAFRNEDRPTPPSRSGSPSSSGGGGFGALTTADGAPTPLSISQMLKARGGFSPKQGGAGGSPTAGTPSSSSAAAAAAASPAALSMPSPASLTGNERPASPSDSAGRGGGGGVISAAAAGAAATAIPTFSEIARGVISRHGAADIPLEPFARARIKAAEEQWARRERAAEEGWARREAQRLERDRRWRIRMLSGATLVVLVGVLVCRALGVGEGVPNTPRTHKGKTLSTRDFSLTV